MKLTGLFKRGAACLCTAAILMGGVSAFVGDRLGTVSGVLGARLRVGADGPAH